MSDILKILSEFEAEVSFHYLNGMQSPLQNAKDLNAHNKQIVLLTMALRVAIEELKYQITASGRYGPTTSLELTLDFIKKILNWIVLRKF